jgi:glycosyltransferase involved in cell wall biosynthesis
MPPKFSVIIAAYNAANYIGQTIQSVIAQTTSDWELIVADDGSTDSTIQVAKDFDDKRIIVISREHQGVSAARNGGFAASHGLYVLFLDADDILFADTLDRLGNELDEYPEAVLSFGTCSRFEFAPPTRSDAREPIRVRRKPHGDALASLLRRNALPVGSVLARRDAVARSQGFEPALRMGEDWAFWCDLAALGPIRYVGKKPVFAYRCHRNSAMRKLSSNPRGLWPAIDLVFARNAVTERYSTKKLARLRRHAESFALSVASRELLRSCKWHEARQTLCAALKREPLSPESWCFLPFAIIGWLPAPARRLLN